MTPSPDAVDQSESILSDSSSADPKSYTCLRCGHYWTPKDQSRPPRCCSLCRSAYWDSPAAGEMTDEARAVAQARIRGKVTQRAAAARRATAIRKLHHWAEIVGPDAIRILQGAILNGATAEKINEIRESIIENNLTTASPTARAVGMPPPPRFDDGR